VDGAVTFWHGSGRIDGDRVVPGDGIATTRAAGDAVYVTTKQSLAETYAATVDGPAWIYEVEPIGDVVPVAPLIGGPVISFRCPEARIIRRYTISNARRERLRSLVDPAAWAPRGRGSGPSILDR
jgi:hypothetical protein